jgi:hypothetical protein
MPGWLKALLIIAIVGVMLVVGVIGAGYFWWVRNRDTFRTRGRETAAAGREFGRNSDNSGCVDETFSRYKKEPPGFFNAIYDGNFMRACLEVSRPTPGFCDNVPNGKAFELMTWRETECQRYNVPNDQKCGHLLMPEIMLCGEQKQGERKEN